MSDRASPAQAAPGVTHSSVRAASWAPALRGWEAGRSLPTGPSHSAHAPAHQAGQVWGRPAPGGGGREIREPAVQLGVWAPGKWLSASLPPGPRVWAAHPCPVVRGTGMGLSAELGLPAARWFGREMHA